MKNKLLIGSIFLFAAILRSIPLIRFGLVLDEFDPYFNYKVTRYMCENGLKAFVSWHDDTVWYPKGRDILDTTYPGMMFYAYLIHKCVSIFFRTAVYDICVIFPILGGLFTLYSIYSLTKFISNNQCAIIALFLSSLIPGLSQRTMSGFFDYECISIALINLCFLYYLKYLKSGKTQDMCIFIFTYFNLGMCWGGYVFVMNFIALHSISCMITNKYQKLLSTCFPNLVCKRYNPKIFPVLYLVGNGLLYIVPVIGKKCFMSQEQIVPLFALLLHMLTFKKLRIPTLFAIPIVLYTSNAAFKTGKLLNLFIKQKGSALVESISEHLPRGFVRFYLDCNILCFIMPLSFTALFDLKHFNSTFMLIYATICVFISAKIVRCILLAAPCFCICSSMYINKVYESVKNNPFQKRLFLGLSAIVSIFYTIHSSKVAYHTYSVPQLLLCTTDGRVITDFHDTYRFLSRFDGVILNWWDYGYQINAYSKIKTLNDNNTNDWDRIREVAQIFMSSEEDAYKQCLKNNIDCVFITSGVDNGYSQDMIAKSGWINKIATENCNFTNAGKESMLYKLVYFGNSSLYDHVRKGIYEPVQLKYFTLAYRSEHNIVKIYSVNK